MSPGICMWSAALHDAIKPRAHLLLEPRKEYKPFIQDFQATRKNTYWLPEAGESWELYMNMFEQDNPPPKWPKDYPNIVPRTVPPEEGVNPDIIFTGNISESELMNNRVLAQFIATIPRERWLMTFGRVRFLTWILDETKVRYVPRTIAGRLRSTVMAEAVCDVTEVASTDTISMGRGHPKPADIFMTNEDGKVVPKTSCERTVKLSRGRPRKKTCISVEEEPTEEELESTPELEASILESLADVEESTAPNLKKEQPRLNLTTIISTLRDLQAKHPTSSPLATTETSFADLRDIARELSTLKLSKPKSKGISKILSKLKEMERTFKTSASRIEKRLEDFLSDPANEGTWVEGMEHPGWFYKDKIPELAMIILRKRKAAAELACSESDIIARVGKNMKVISLDNVLQRFERPEEVEPPAVNLGDSENKDKLKRMLEGYNKNYGGARSSEASQDDLREDELFSYEHKLLEYYKRDQKPIKTAPEDFYPETPLALLDFTPKVLHPYLCNPDSSQREQTWETFSWLIRTLLLLRAHPISSALGTLAPGGEHILQNLSPGVTINPDQRLRTLTADQFIEVTRAWETWPFRSELLHLEDFHEINSDDVPMQARSIKTLKFKNPQSMKKGARG